MVSQEKVTLIVTVCKLQENGMAKCHQYWPDSSSETDQNFKQLIYTPGLKISKLTA
jgi:protein tyrosine phosphatase